MGEWHENKTCDAFDGPLDCNPPVLGACCKNQKWEHPHGGGGDPKYCHEVTQYECGSYPPSGHYKGNHVKCEDVLGSCCNPSTGHCTENISEGDCLYQYGNQVWLGCDSNCDDYSCEGSLGTCCIPGDGCHDDFSEMQCNLNAGAKWTCCTTCEDTPCYYCCSSTDTDTPCYFRPENGCRDNDPLVTNCGDCDEKGRCCYTTSQCTTCSDNTYWSDCDAKQLSTWSPYETCEQSACSMNASGACCVDSVEGCIDEILEYE